MQMPASIPKLSSSISLGNMRVSQNKKWELLISPDNFYTERLLVRVNAYKCAKFQVSSSISYGDMEGVQE